MYIYDIFIYIFSFGWKSQFVAYLHVSFFLKSVYVHAHFWVWVHTYYCAYVQVTEQAQVSLYMFNLVWERVSCSLLQIPGYVWMLSVFSWLPLSFAEGALALQRQVTAGTLWLLSTLTQVFRQSQEEVCPLSHLLRSIATKFYITCLSEPQRFNVWNRMTFHSTLLYHRKWHLRLTFL